MPEFLEHFFNAAALGLPVVYYAALVLKKGFQKASRRLVRNTRAYLLVFEYSFMLFFFGGLLGTLILYHPRLSTSLISYGIDAEELLSQSQIEVSEANLRRARGCLWDLGGWFLGLGVVTAAGGRREVFDDVRKALHYYVRRRASLQAATYVSTGGIEPIRVAIVFNPADSATWNQTVEQVQQKVVELDTVFRIHRQGVNVRVVLEMGTRRLHYWRFGSHACLVAEARDRVDIRLWRRLLFPFRRTGDREFRGLVYSIRAIASIHGA